LDIYWRTHNNAETSKITTETHQHTWDEWHCKYGHVSATGLEWLLADKLVDGFEVDKTSTMGDCDACIQAKQSHMPFPKKAKS
jgi:GAG-pre-integrase domain